MAEGNSAIYQPPAVPEASDAVLFCNGLMPATGRRNRKTKENILEFRRHGKNNLDLNSWYPLEKARRPGTIEVSDGVFTDGAGRIYFWQMFGKDVLKLISSDGEYALLQLEKY